MAWQLLAAAAASYALAPGDKSKQRTGATTADINKAIGYIQQTTDRARQDIFGMTPVASQNRLAGKEAGLNIFKQAIPEQLGAFQSGNMNAQQTLTAGLPEQIKALMGQQYDLGALQPKQANVNLDFVQNAQIPDYQPVVPPSGAGQPQLTPEQLANLRRQLAQLNLGGFR